MSELSILNDLMNNLEAIDVNRSLDNQSLINAVCSMFLNRGCNLLYLYSDDRLGWLYFEDGLLVSVYTEEKSDYDALHEIVSWSDINIKEYRSVDIVEHQFVLGMNEFMDMLNEVGDSKFSDDIPNNDLFKDFSLVEGVICFENGVSTYEENFSIDDFPLNFAETLCEFDSEGKGIYLNLNQSSEKINCYILKKSNQLWALTLSESKDFLENYDHFVSEVQRVLYAS